MSEQHITPEKNLQERLYEDIVKPLVDIARASKAMLGIYIPYFIEGLVYFGFLTILGKFASENLNVSDEQAGIIYSFFTGGITFAMLVLGGWSDKLGVRKSLILAFILMVIGRIIVSFSGTLQLGSGMWSPMFFAIITGLIFVVIAYGLFQPAAYAGVKELSTKKNSAMGYAVIYGLMNLGSFASGFVSSLTRPHFESVFPPNGLTSVFWVYALLTGVSLILTWTLLTKKSEKDAKEDVKRQNKLDGETVEDEEKEDDSYKDIKVNNVPLYILGALVVISFLLSGMLFESPFNKHFDMLLFGKSVSINVNLWLSAILVVWAFVEYVRRRPYHPFNNSRFTFFVFILIPVQTLFAHNWLTLPYYLDRAFQGTVVSEYFEVFANLNPVLIFLLTPIIAAMTIKADVYKMMIWGTLIMALPTFLLTVGPNVYLFIIYVIGMTIGEAMWSPRFLQWIAEVAPKGKVGLYMGVGQFPWFLDKVFTGFYSGYFLNKYCPKDVPPDQLQTGKLWLIYSIIAIITPIALILAKKWMMKGFHAMKKE